MAEQQPQSSGVQELIDRLSEEGVAEGERQAENLRDEAQKKAGEILAAARKEAGDIVEQAKGEAERFKKAGEEALQLASRDAVRNLQSQIHVGFRNKLRELLAHTLQDGEFLKQMILEVVRCAAPPEEAGPIEIRLAAECITDDELRKRIESGEEGQIVDFIQGMTGDGIREGFTLATSETDQPGIRVRVVEDDVEIELTESSLSELLARHLLPRFRAVMQSL